MPASAAYDLKFWRDEIDKSRAVAEPYWSKWQDNLNYYTGTPLAEAPSADYVNVNVDFTQVETKGAQLFFETPELQVTAGQGFEPLAPGIVAHRAVLNALLGCDRMDVLTTIQKAIKDCTCTAGFGPTVIGYQPTIQEVPPDIQQPGAVLGLSQPAPVPVHEAWFWLRIPSKKYRIPADFYDTDFDAAPWLAMEFRLPLREARTICNLPPDFEGTKTRDDKRLESGPQNDAEATLAYVDGTLVWYKAALYDDDVIHPEVYRRHVIIEGLEGFADKDDPMWRSPYQTLDPTGRLTADSMRGNPIHVLTLRDVPDSAYVPSDAQMTRALVKELCLFRTQMVAERDVNKPKFVYKTSVFPRDAIAKLETAMTGSMIGLPDEAWQGGSPQPTGFALLAQGASPRQTYLANDYIKRDIQETLALDAAGVGVEDGEDETATKTAAVERARNVRLDAERKRVLRWYLKGVDKVSALALRFLTDPKRVAELVGPELAQTWLQYRQMLTETGDARPIFTARPDSQIKIDAAVALKQALNIYNFAAKDPMVNRGEILRRIFDLAGWDASKFIAPELPEQKPEPSLGFSFKGEDFNPLMPQFPITVEILAQCGVEVSQDAILQAQDGAQNQMQAQLLMAEMQPTGANAKPGEKKPAPHGGLADKMGPLSKQDGEQTGNRPGPSVQ